MYLWFAVCLMVIARKRHVTVWWIAWVPILNFWTVCAAGKSSTSCSWRLAVSLACIAAGIVLWLPVWVVVWLIIWAIFWTLAWTRVAHECGRSSALGLMSPFPVLSLVLFGLLAFGE
ncbi:MAG: hypothetical protein JXA58_01395 [Dehalococcoidia bacterium]|nr:hypothetical protein [Dehalococcoidia bacterium]